MKRDMNLIRSICLAIEQTDDEVDTESLAFGNFTPKQIARHVELLIDEDMIAVYDVSSSETDYPTFRIVRLTSVGHDFLDSARNETIWKKATDKITATVGGAAIGVLTDLLKSYSMRAIGLSHGDSE